MESDMPYSTYSCELADRWILYMLHWLLYTADVGPREVIQVTTEMRIRIAYGKRNYTRERSEVKIALKNASRPGKNDKVCLVRNLSSSAPRKPSWASLSQRSVPGLENQRQLVGGSQ